jgi:hypothetical protein
VAGVVPQLAVRAKAEIVVMLAAPGVNHSVVVLRHLVVEGRVKQGVAVLRLVTVLTATQLRVLVQLVAVEMLATMVVEGEGVTLAVEEVVMVVVEEEDPVFAGVVTVPSCLTLLCLELVMDR